jgi:flagellar basal body-associated protein FliL
LAEKNPKGKKDSQEIPSTPAFTLKKALLFGGLVFLICSAVSFSVFLYLTSKNNSSLSIQEVSSLKQEGVLEIDDPDQVLRGAVYGFDPFVVNLKNNSGIIYLTVSVEFYDFVVPDDIESRAPALRDYIISRLSDESASTLTSKGPPYIKEILIDGLNEKISEDNPIEKVFVENFLIR